MKLLEKILIPIDANSLSESQLQMAKEVSRRFNSKILILSVLPEESEIKAVHEYLVKFIGNESNSIIQKLAESNLKAESLLRYGNFFEQVLEVSEAENVNVILLPVQNNGNESGISVDLIPEKLVRKSQKPVWLLKEGLKGIPERIVCPVDFSDSSERALNNAIRIARVFDARLHIINVFRPVQESFLSRLEIDVAEENRQLEEINSQELTKYISKFNLTGINYAVEILKGLPEEQIVDFAKRNQIDLIFMGATGKSYIQRILLGSVTESVIRELPCSLIVTKAENLLNLKIDSDISKMEKHLQDARFYIEKGFYSEALNELEICLNINNLHLPVIKLAANVHEKLGNSAKAEYYQTRFYEIKKRLWSDDLNNFI